MKDFFTKGALERLKKGIIPGPDRRDDQGGYGYMYRVRGGDPNFVKIGKTIRPVAVRRAQAERHHNEKYEPIYDVLSPFS